ncbi:MAG: ribonuclease HII [Verrucomicrobiota bacterium]
MSYEREAWASGYTRVAGLDEVGRGPLAGPVVACAVVFASSELIPAGLNDSKRLTASRREALAAELRSCAQTVIGVGIVEPAEIDRLNILRATHWAMKLAVDDLSLAADFLLVDGLPVPGLPVPSRAIVKGDSLSASIAAASIIAKVTRDGIMTRLSDEYPGYGFDAHKGYGTRAHLAALKAAGPSPVHRMSFAPVRACALGTLRQGTLNV